MLLIHQLNKESIKSLIASVFAMQACGNDVDFEVDKNYKFEVKFTVKEDHLQIISGNIYAIKNKE
jgi:hypothetical protein